MFDLEEILVKKGSFIQGKKEFRPQAMFGTEGIPVKRESSL